MSLATLLRYWRQQSYNLGLGLVLLVEHIMAKTDLLIVLIGVESIPLLSSNAHTAQERMIAEYSPARAKRR